MPRPDTAAIAAGPAERMAELARELVGSEPSARTRDTLRFRRRGSLSVRVGGPRRGRWCDFQAGVGGGPFALIRHLRGCSRQEARAWALRWLGSPSAAGTPPPRAPGPARSPARPAEGRPGTLDLARRLWREAGSAAGSLAEAYLRGRGLRPPEGAPLRFHPCAWRNPADGPAGPALLALMTHPAGHGPDGRPLPVGVHVTYLRPDGGGKAEGPRPRIMLGGAGVVRLVPDEEVTLGLGLAEGTETALSVVQGAGWGPVWAAGSAGGIRTFPVLAGLAALTVFVDADDGGAGLAAGRGCRDRWRAAGREVRVVVPRPGEDLNDALRRTAA